MAFNFFGTFTTGQWNEFLSFISIQRTDLQKRRDWLSAALARNGVFNTEYDSETNYPTYYDQETGEGGFTCTPESSYGGKLLAAYRILGGVPEDDMLLRTSDKPIFLTRGTTVTTGEGGQNTGYSDLYSNGRRDRGGMRFDRDMGASVEAVKKPFLEVIKHKRERLEFKIKRALDYSDQLQIELEKIDALLGDGDDSLNALLSRVQSNADLSGSLGVVDNPEDKFGLDIGRVGDLAYDDSLKEAEEENLRVPK